MCDSVPDLIYYIYVPVIFVVFLLGFFVFFSNRKKIENRLFLILSFIFVLWMFFNLMNFISINYDDVLLYDKLSIIGTFIPVIFVIFAHSLVGKIISKTKALLIFLSILPFVLLSTTSYNIIGLTDPPECETIPGALYYFMMGVIIFYTLWAFIIFYKNRKDKNEAVRKQIKIIFSGFAFFIIWALVTNVIAQFSSFSSLSLVAPIGVVVLVSAIAYAIVKYQFLNIKLIATQALTAVIWILISSQYFFAGSMVSILLVTFTLLLSILFGIILVKSVKLEVQRKEQLQEITNKLAIANDQLRTLDNAKSEFISIASHQLRTPLTASKGYLSLLLEGSYGKVPAKQNDVLSKIYQSNERLITLVEDLLSLSRIESGRMEYKFEKVKIDDICHEIYDTFIIRSKERGLTLELILPEKTLPEAMTDHNKIREVISNLVDNAIKYTPQGGVQVTATQVGKNIRVAVKDTGIGVPKEEMPYLFAKFSRGKDVNRLSAGGTGLGLHVGKRMMENLKGNLWLESEGAGKGSTFYVEVPMEIEGEIKH